MLSERSKSFLIALVSSWFVIFPAYLDFSILDDSDMTLSFPAFGKVDQDELIPSSQRRAKIVNFTFLWNKSL